MDGKTNFILYKDFKPNVDILSNEQAGMLLKALFEYVENRKEPNFDDDGMLKMAFITLQTTLERDLKKYKKTVERNRENGKKGGRPKEQGQETQSVNDKPKEPSGLNGNPNNPSEPKKADSGSDSVSDNGSDRDIERDKEIDKEVKDPIPYKDVIDYLNKVVGSGYEHTTPTHRDKIKKRFKEGHTFEDFKKVIDVKHKEWAKDNKFSKYLRPSTLFGTKFTEYLNQKNMEKPEVDWRTR